jgi:YidC/Oxa1 family membrane protein insertase
MKKKIILLLILSSLLTGCARNLKDENNKIVQNKITGQNLTENILCKPNDEKNLEIYNNIRENKIEKYNNDLEEQLITKKDYDNKIKKIVDVNKLPVCTEYKITDGGYGGIWETFFVKPLAWLIINLGKLFKNYGVSIIVSTIFIRMLTVKLTRNTAVQSENMALAKPEIDKIEKKYRGREDRESLIAKNQEIMLLYKKYNINVFSGCIFALIQIPLFFAFNEALNRLPIIFEESFLIWHLGTAPKTAFQTGNFSYLLIPIIVFITTYYSFKLNKTASMNKDQEKQMENMMNFSIIMIGVTAFITSTALALYWITNSLFTIIQNLYLKGKRLNDNKKRI